MRWVRVALLTYITVGACAQSAAAHVVPRGPAARVGPVVPIQELSDADLDQLDLDDASIADWEDVLGSAVIMASDFWYYQGSYYTGNQDYRIWLGWHDATNRIYCAVEFVDDLYVNPGADWRSRNHLFWAFWHQDSSVHFKVDGDHSGGPYDSCGGDDEVVKNREAQFYMATAERSGIITNVYLMTNSNSYPASWASYPPYAYGGGGHFGEQPTIYVTEFHVTPFDTYVWDDEAACVVSDLRPGDVIGFAIGLSDFDEPWRPGREVYESIQGFPTPEAGWGYCGSADAMVDGLLLPHGDRTAEVGVSPLPATSWARIKAHLRVETQPSAKVGR